MNVKNIFFDLDGTLTNPQEGITKCIQYGLSKIGIVESDLEALKHFIGPPLLKHLQCTYNLTDDQAEKALYFYRERFKRKGMYENFLYGDITKLLTGLNKQGYTLFVCTSKPEIFARQIIQYFKLESFFDGVFGSELDGKYSDKSKLIHRILNVKKIHSNSVLMVGDRKYDIIGARLNNIRTIAVSYGFGSKSELLNENPYNIVDTVNDLYQLFNCNKHL